MCTPKYFILFVCFSSLQSRKISKSQEVAIVFLVLINMTSHFLWLIMTQSVLSPPVSNTGKVFIY